MPTPTARSARPRASALITGRYQYRLPIGLQEPLGPAGRRPAARAPDRRLAAARGGLSHHADRQVALGRAAQIRPAQERLRRVLGPLRRRRRLFPPRLRRPPGLVGRRDPRRGGRLHHRSPRRPRRSRRSTSARRTASRSSSACISPRRTGRGKRTTRKAARKATGIGQSPSGARRRHPALRRRHARHLCAMMKSLDDNIGRVLQRLAALGLDRRHDRGLHQRQRRRALQRHLAVHRQEDRAARRRPARARDRALARAWSARGPERGADHLDGLAADFRRGRRAAGRTRPSRATASTSARRWPAASLPERSLFWRYGNKSQRAHRRGDYKYLKINDNEFLFDVVADPLERANLKDRQPERFAALKAGVGAMGRRHAARSRRRRAPATTPANLADHFNLAAASPSPELSKPSPRTPRTLAVGAYSTISDTSAGWRRMGRPDKVRCAECGAEVSVLREFCLKCGAPTDPGLRERRQKLGQGRPAHGR